MQDVFAVRLYPILDVGLLAAHGMPIEAFASDMRAAGVGLLQLRDKLSAPAVVLHHAGLVQKVLSASACRLILNDRPDLAVLAGADGVHVGQDDLSPEDARRVVGSARLVGVSTHTVEQMQAAQQSSADYVAIGPVFATHTKADASPVVGLDGVQRARAQTNKPLVAIGGITRKNARSVVDAGADCVAVISALLGQGESPARIAGDFLDLLR